MVRKERLSWPTLSSSAAKAVILSRDKMQETPPPGRADTTQWWQWMRPWLGRRVAWPHMMAAWGLPTVGVRVCANLQCSSSRAAAEPRSSAADVRLPLATALARDAERSADNAAAGPSRSASAPENVLWSRTLPQKTRAAFVRRVLSRITRDDRDLPSVVRASYPHALDALQVEELQCVVLDAALRAPSSCERLAQVYARATPLVPPPGHSALRRLQRATLFRLFSAMMDAHHYADAALVLKDPRLRPAQPKHLARLLLRRLATRPPSLLCADPRQSPRAALRAACDALRQLQGPMDASAVVFMMQCLAERRMYAELVKWTAHASWRVPPTCQPPRHAISALVRRVCVQQGAPAEAAALVLALPPAWRTHAMYQVLMVHHRMPAMSAELLQELFVSTGELDAHSLLAHLEGHARRGDAAQALRDYAAMKHTCALNDEATASLLVAQAICAAGRVSLCLRMAQRRPALFAQHGTLLLNALLAGVLRVMRTTPLSACERAMVLRQLYACVLSAAAHGASARTGASAIAAINALPVALARLPPVRIGAPVSCASLLSLLAHIARIAGAHAVQPNKATLLLLVRAAAQWDTEMDSSALWHVAGMALPDMLNVPRRVPEPAAEARGLRRRSARQRRPWPASRRALLVELAAAFARRHDWRNVRRAQTLVQRLSRRVTLAK